MSNSNSAIAEVVAKGLAKAFAKTGNKNDVTMPFHSPELEKLLQGVFSDITKTTALAKNITQAITPELIAQQLATLANTVQNDTATSLDEATPAAASEIGAALAPHLAGARPPVQPADQTAPTSPASRALPATQATPASPPMPGEGVGEDTQSPGTQPTESAPISDTPGTPDEDVNENPTAPDESNQPLLRSPSSGGQATTPAHPNAVSPESANLGDGAPTFNQAASPEQQQAAMPGFAQQEQDKQLAEQAVPDGSTPGQSPQAGTPPPGATQPGGTAGSGLPGVAVPQQAPAAGAATPQEQAKEALKQEQERQKAEKANTVGSIGRMKNKWGRRNEIKKVDEKIKDSTKKLRDVEFKYATEYILLVCFKEFTDLIMAALSLTGFLAFIGTGFSAICLAGQGLILWWQTKQWRKEVYNNKMALQAIVVFIIELIPILNILPLNIINAYALQVQSERRQKRHRDNLEKLEKQRHKLVNARKL